MPLHLILLTGGARHPCYRPCVAGVPMQCNYTMTLTLYSTWSMHCGDCPGTRSHCSNPGCITAGGTDRVVYVANLMLPGPAVHVSLRVRVVTFRSIVLSRRYPNNPRERLSTLPLGILFSILNPQSSSSRECQ